eukprot:INCI14778.9.p1 GENE.INCI14778.9~~INCI14778.9.p1  ORF type:complete len:1002 (-),score=145.66 INCI14778.9:371-3376(-)
MSTEKEAPVLLFAGAGSSRIDAAPHTEPLGGYWGRTGKGQQPRPSDTLEARVVTLRSSFAKGKDPKIPAAAAATSATCIISLDLVGIDAATCDSLKAAVLALPQAALAGLRGPQDILVCCTHTHTGPQTHACFVGMGHASPQYMAYLQTAVVSAVSDSIAALAPARIVRSTTRPLEGVAVNRRERVVVADTGGAAATTRGQSSGPSSSENAANSKPVRWFEEAGKTKLGQRPGGPRVACAEVVEIQPGIATLVCFACHPTCMGPAMEQSADYCGAVRRCIERGASTSSLPEPGLVIYLNGACGDVNPVRHRGGVEAAEETGAAIAEVVLDVLRGTRSEKADETVAGCFPVELQNDLEILKLSRGPIPSAAEAARFAQMQAAWVAEEAALAGRRTPAGSSPLGIACAQACHEYALDIQDMAERRDGGDEVALAKCRGAETVDFRVQVCRIGDAVQIVAMEGEIFAGYALNLANTGRVLARDCCRRGGVPLNVGVPIVVGYANGCVGYVPTEQEYPWGGYEVCHAFRVYGQPTMLAPTVERDILSCANRLLQAQAQRREEVQSAGSRNPARGNKQGILAVVADSNFPAAHDTYNSIGADCTESHVYFVLSSELPHDGAKLFRTSVPTTSAAEHDAEAQQGAATDDARRSGDQTVAVQCLGDLTTDACLDPPGCIVQGKSHVPLVDCGPALGIVFATHVGFYSFRDGMETLSVPGDPELEEVGRKPYPGGVVLSYLPDVGDGECPWLRHGRVPDGEGVLTMAIDSPRRRAFFLTWPSGRFGVCDLHARGAAGNDFSGAAALGGVRSLQGYPEMHSGELVHPRTGEYRCVCRSMVVDPRTGRVYWTNASGDVLEYDDDVAQDDHGQGPATAGRKGLLRVISAGDSGGLRRDYFGSYSPSDPGHMAYHWRQVQWVDGLGIVGVHGNSGMLFRLTIPGHGSGDSPRSNMGGGWGTARPWSVQVEILDRIASKLSQRLGMHDQFSYGYEVTPHCCHRVVPVDVLFLRS